MESRSSLWGREFDFFAIDLDGFAAVLSTAGYGPVPLDVAAWVDLEDSRIDLLDDLPAVGSAVVELADCGDTSFWQKFAERGLYSFDWKVWDGPFRRVCLPSAPVRADDLPLDVSNAFALPVRFRGTSEVDLIALGIECDASQWGRSSSAVENEIDQLARSDIPGRFRVLTGRCPA